MPPSTDLKKWLSARFKSGGPMSVHDYMEAALGHPDFGYYIKETPFGRGGDFITAPEVSQMFGELVGIWAAQVWMDLGSPEEIALVELGPGRGTLMADILRTVSRALPAFNDAIQLHLVEMSPRLRAEQASKLDGMAARAPTWHDTADSLPDGPMIAIANEFFDALPIHQYVRSHDGWYERMVGEGVGGDGTIGFCLADEAIEDEGILPQAVRNAAIESIAETRPAAQAMVHLLAERIASGRGAALVIDYGYEKSAAGDTFQGVQNHLPQHVLNEPGKADLTAHVDFEVLIQAARAAGAAASAVVGQGDFLRQLGIETRATKLGATATPEQRADIQSALERLTADLQMGSLFKAFTFYTPQFPEPPGFEQT